MRHVSPNGFLIFHYYTEIHRLFRKMKKIALSKYSNIQRPKICPQNKLKSGLHELDPKYLVRLALCYASMISLINKFLKYFREIF